VERGEQSCVHDRPCGGGVLWIRSPLAQKLLNLIQLAILARKW